MAKKQLVDNFNEAMLQFIWKHAPEGFNKVLFGTLLSCGRIEEVTSLLNTFEVEKQPNCIYKFMDASTGHITSKDNDLLQKDKFPLSVYEHTQGYFVYSGRIFQEKEKWEAYMAKMAEELKAFGMSDSFIKLWQFAVKNDCWYLHLDSDGMAVDNMDWHEW